MVTVRVESGNLAAVEADAVVVNLFEAVTAPGGGTGALDQALGGQISALIDDGAIKGKRGEITTLFTFGRTPAKRVLIVGLGKQKDFDLDTVRSLAANVARALRKAGAKRAATIVHGAGIAGLDPEACAQAIAEGTVMGLYRFTKYKKSDGEQDPDEVVLVEHDPSKIDALQRGVSRGLILAEAVNFCRDMANEPSNQFTPSEMAARARQAADEAGLECQVLDREDMVELGMGALLGVAQGSHQPPKFIVLHYRGNPTTDQAIGLIGKGITFDTGGISIKPAAGMEEMKGDMSGGASVIAALRAIGLLRPRVNVTGIVPATENMPGGGAIKPGDVLRAMNGTTIEAVNTDAEGRLILSDGISYARSLDLNPIVDIATLTGAIGVALGDQAVGVMSNDQPTVDRIIAAGKRSGERLWQMPLYDEYKEQIKSDVADLKNTGGRPAGALTAAMFLKEFADTTPWVHLDMAGVDFYTSDKGAIVKGASGIPVRTLVAFTRSFAEEAPSK
ncbi:MAG: leucyl aminopeptidase [Dehalococcoidia bacterium]